MIGAAKRQLVRLAIGQYLRRNRRKFKGYVPVRERMSMRQAEILKEAYNPGANAILSGFLLPAELIHAYRFTPVFTEVAAAIIAGVGYGVKALEAAEARGYSRDGCSFHRAALGAALEDYFPRLKMIVATSHLCDGQNKALEAITEHCRVPYFLLDVPQEKTNASVEYLAGQLAQIEDEMAAISGRRVSDEEWKQIFAISNETRDLMIRVKNTRRRSPSPIYGQSAFTMAFQAMMMMGTEFLRDCYQDLVREVESGELDEYADGEKYRIIWLLAYPYFKGNFLKYLEEELGVRAVAEELSYIYWQPLDPALPLHSLASKMLDHPHLGPLDNRLAVMEEFVRDYSADGVLHYSHWGCRQGCGGVRQLRDAAARLGVPFLDLDGDCVDDRNYSDGQTRTRLEGFVELMGKEKGARKTFVAKKKKDKLYLGIDIGSLSAEAVIVDGSGKVVDYEVILTGASSRRAAERLRRSIFGDRRAFDGRIAACIATGYGRNAVDYADKQVTEITCHARGMAHQLNGVRTIIDIGGQDTKAIAVEPDGTVVSFMMNDKCAAGTGRFIEVMARTLEIDLEDFGPTALQTGKGVRISSMCTVFAESEVVSLIAEGKPIEEIARGVCESIASRTASMLDRVGRRKKIAMSGGVAKNVGVVKALEKALGSRIVIPNEPQIIGALGAALIAREIHQ